MSQTQNLTSAFHTLHRVFSIARTTNTFSYTQKFFLYTVQLQWKKDRALDVAVEKEKNLRSVVSVKDILKKEPEACMPIDALSRKKKKLGIRNGVSNFIKKYPSVFELCDGDKCKLTKEALELEEEEARIHQEEESDAATRLCKLLMMTREKKLHLDFINQLKWDMGLPQNYVKTLVPNYPDYFTVINMPDNRPGLDLVCWNDTLAVSEMERRAANKGEYKKNMPLAFPMNYSKGYAVKQGYTKWAEEWQRLPYISPYEDASHIVPLSDLSERRVVGVLHELLSLTISKRTVRRYIIELREQLGLPEKFEKCLDRHPGIFYLSLKNGTVTVVLREAYKRNKLIEEHALMKSRGKFLHVMKKGFGDKRKGLKKKGISQQEDSLAAENVRTDHVDHEGDSEDEKSEEDNTEDEESQEDESADDRNYAGKVVDDDEEEEVTTDEESSEDDKDVYERDLRTHGKQRGRSQSSGKQATNFKPSGRQGSDSKPQRQSTDFRNSILEDKSKRTLGKHGKRFDTSIKKGSSYQTFGGQGRGLETAGREGKNFETSGRKERSFERSERQGRSFETSGKQGRSFERSERQGRSFETSGRKGRSSEISEKQGRSFDTSGKQGRSFETSERQGRNFGTSGRKGRSSEISERQGRSFETSERKGRSSEISERQDRRFETSGKKRRSFDVSHSKQGKRYDTSDGKQGRSSDTSARMQVRSFDTSGRRETNFKTSKYQHGTIQEPSKQGNKLKISRSRYSKYGTSGSQGSYFEVSQSRGTRKPSQKQSGNSRAT